MLLTDAAKEFIFDCKVRKLSEATIYGYQKQIEYLVKYIETNYSVNTAEAGVSKDVRVSPHTCRHTFAHLQLKNGLDCIAFHT